MSEDADRCRAEVDRLREEFYRALDERFAGSDRIWISKLEECEKHTASLRERMDSLGRLYDERHLAAKEAVAAALASQDKLTSQAFSAAKEAIQKAETAQGEYNIRSNEFRGQLADQAKELMPRRETESLIGQLREQHDRIRDELRTSIADLRESRSEIGGRSSQSRDARTQHNWLIDVLVAIGAVVATLLWHSAK